RGTQEPAHELSHFVGIEPLARLDCGPAGEGRGEALETVGPTTESPSGEIRDELLETPRGVEPWMRIRSGVHHDALPGKRLDLVSHSLQQRSMGFDRVQLG